MLMDTTRAEEVFYAVFFLSAGSHMVTSKPLV